MAPGGRASPGSSPPVGDPRIGESARRFGLWIFFASLSVLFLASLIGILIVRSELQDPTQPVPPLPRGLWAATAVLLSVSAAAHWSVVAARRGQMRALRSASVLTFTAAVAFVALQVKNWLELIDRGLPPTTFNLHIWGFYLLTALHAAHVLGGLVAAAVVLRRTYAGLYGPTSHGGLWRMAAYWHFLDAVWIVLFIVLLSSHA